MTEGGAVELAGVAAGPARQQQVVAGRRADSAVQSAVATAAGCSCPAAVQKPPVTTKYFRWVEIESVK